MELRPYLVPTSVIDSDSKVVQEKANSLVESSQNQIERARSIYYYVRDEIAYDVYTPLFPFQASSTLMRGYGFCIHKAILLAALARAIGIHSRLGFADIRSYIVSRKLVEFQGTNVLLYHGFAELFLEEKWVKATPAFDIKICREHKIVPVEFDGTADALLNSKGTDGRPQVEYIRYHGSFSDLPLDKMMHDWIETYGQEYIDSWRKGFPELKKGQDSIDAYHDK